MNTFTCPNCGLHTFITVMNGEITVGVCTGYVPYIPPEPLPLPLDLPPATRACSFVWDRANETNYFT